MPAQRKTSHEQMKLLLECLEEDKFMTIRCNRDPVRQQIMNKWEALATRLNLVKGYTKTAQGWRNYWTELKYSIRKKAAIVRSDTEMGCRTRRVLNNFEERVMALAGLSTTDIGTNSFILVPAARPSENPLSSQSRLDPEQSADNSQESAESQPQDRRHNVEPFEVPVTNGPQIKCEDTDSDTSSSRRLSKQRSRSLSRSPVAGRGRAADAGGAGAGAGRRAGWAVAGWARRLEERRVRTDADMARSLRSLAASAASQARSMQLMLELMNDFYETMQQRPPPA